MASVPSKTIETGFPWPFGFSELQGSVKKQELIELFDAKVRPDAETVLDRVFEVPSRSIQDPRFGVAFPIYPELMASAMKFTKGKEVLEIAGASGENAIIFALSGAKKVYMNDIDPKEMKTFGIFREYLPQITRDKLESIEGNCLDLLSRKPDLKVDLVLCRNLIHFFNGQDQERFFANLKKLLRPGGIAIVTVNSIYADSANEKLLKTNPNDTAFRISQCVLTDYQAGQPTILYREIEPTSGANVSTDFEARYLYKKEPREKKWEIFQDQFRQLDPDLQKRIKDLKAKNDWGSKLKSLKEGGSLRVLSNHFRLFNESNLRSLFEEQGFEVLQGFSLQANGHLAEEYAFGKVQQIGVIVRAPGV